jgi:hypothetical protein
VQLMRAVLFAIQKLLCGAKQMTHTSFSRKGKNALFCQHVLLITKRIRCLLNQSSQRATQ